jgi:hypothetical protein
MWSVYNNGDGRRIGVETVTCSFLVRSAEFDGLEATPQRCMSLLHRSPKQTSIVKAWVWLGAPRAATGSRIVVEVRRKERLPCLAFQ